MLDKLNASRYHGISGKLSDLGFHTRVIECLRQTRKYLRLLGFISLYEQYSLLLRSESGDKGGTAKSRKGVERQLKIVSNVLYGLFIAVDNISLLSRLQFLQVSETTLLTFSNALWLASLLFNTLSLVVKLVKLAIKEDDLEHGRNLTKGSTDTSGSTEKQRHFIQMSRMLHTNLSDTEEEQQSKKSKMIKHNSLKVKHTLELCKNLSDLFLGVHFTGITRRCLKHDFGESLLGIAGTTSSLIGLYQISQ